MKKVCLLDLVEFLDNNSRGSTAAVANSCNTVLAWLQLVKKGGQDTRAGATERMAERDGAAELVDAGVLEAEDLLLWLV